MVKDHNRIVIVMIRAGSNPVAPVAQGVFVEQKEEKSDIVNPSDEVNDSRRLLKRWLITAWGSEPKFDPQHVGYLVYQLESTPQTNTLHWQVYVEFLNVQRYKRMGEILGIGEGFKAFACRGTPQECTAYCTKERTRAGPPASVITPQIFGAPFSNGKKRGRDQELEEIAEKLKAGASVKRICEEHSAISLRSIRNIEVFAKYVRPPQVYAEPEPEVLYPWQAELKRVVGTEADVRSVHWYCDKVGNTGKSLMARILEKDGACLMGGGREIDILNGVATFIKSLPEGQDLKTVIFDLTRANKEHLEGFWSAVEKIKNGNWYNGKYEGCKISVKPPHVIIFANYWPQLENLSADRWRLHEIVNNVSIDTDVREVNAPAEAGYVWQA